MTYIAIIGQAFKKASAYKFDNWIHSVLNLLYFLLYIFIWISLYGGREMMMGISLNQMVSYVFINQVLIACNSIYDMSDNISDRIRTGDMALEFLKPISLPTRLMLEMIGHCLFVFTTRILPLYLVISITFKPTFPNQFEVYILFIISALLGILINYLGFFILGCASFWIIEIKGLDSMYHTLVWLFSGALVPQWFMPDLLRNISLYLPWQCIYFIPNSIFVQAVSLQESLVLIYRQVFFVIVLLLTSRFVWNKGSNNLVSQGG